MRPETLAQFRRYSDSREEAERAFYEELAEQRAARRDHDAWTAALAGELADE